MRDVAIIGWGPPDQRIRAIRLIRSELEIGLADAKARFEQLLDVGTPVVIPAANPRCLDLARELCALGGEVRLLSGHANAKVRGLVANDELDDIESQLRDIRSRVARREWLSAIRGARPDLAFQPGQAHPQLGGYALARANRDAIARHERQPQPVTDWTGELALPEALAEYYATFGPADLFLTSYGNPYFLPALKNLWAHQAGYRWEVLDAKKPLEGRRVEDWDDDWLVVGDEGGDPLILSCSTGRVLGAEHGRGAWEPSDVFESVEQMAAVLTAIGAVCESAGTDLTDDDGFIRPRWRAFLEADVDGALGSSTCAHVLEALGFG